jgi:hypothetical protein
MLKNGMPVASNDTVKKNATVPEDVKQQSQKKRIDLELVHARFVRPSRALLVASSAEVWNDLTIRMGPHSDCISCRISTIKATARIKHQSTHVPKPGQVIYVDILPPVSAESLTPKSHFPVLLILVDAFSRFTRIFGIPNKGSQSVTAAMSTFSAEHRLFRGFTLWVMKRLRGMQVLNLIHRYLSNFFADKRVTVSFDPPKHQEGNHVAETWQSLRKLAQCMLVHS